MKLVLPGVPTAWGTHKGYGKRSYSLHTPVKMSFQFLIRSKWKEKLINKPCKVSFTFEMPIPQSTSKKKRKEISEKNSYHTSRPDLTNLQKFAEDCLTGTVIEDDKYVVISTSKKYYSEIPQTIIEIEEL